MPRPVIRPYTASVQFDGSSSELLKNTPTGLNTGTDALSFVSWIYPKGSGLQVFADLLGGAMGRRFSLGGSGGIYYFFSDGVNAANNMTLTTAQYFAAFRPDAPARAVWTVDATEAQLYVNGVLIKTQALGLGMNSGTYTKLVIGRSAVPSLGFTGWANDAYFANKKMTLADVQADYFSAIQPSNVASAWIMNEATGTSIVDRVGSNSLTASSITWSGYAPFKLRNRVLDVPTALTAGVARSDAGGIDVNTSGATAIFRYYPISADGLVACTFEDAATSGIFRLNLESATRRLFTWTVSGGVGRAHKPTYTIRLSEWHEVAFSYKDMGGGNRRSRIYVDGDLIGEETSAGLADTTSKFSASAGATRYVTKMRMFNSELTPEQVSNIYSTGQNLVTPRIHWPLTEGSGNVANDISGNGFHGTISSNAWGSNTPGRNRKDYGGNLLENGNFELYPPLTAATTASPVWVDGTTAGSASNAAFGWYKITGVGNFAVSFDTAVSRSGAASLKLDATNATGRGRALNTPFETTTTEALISKHGIPVLPNTTYTLTGYVKTSNVVASSVRMQVLEYGATGTSGSTSSTAFAPTGSADWALHTVTFTTAATARYVHVKCEMAAAGAIMSAWFDDITLTRYVPDARKKFSNGFVKNGNFEDAPPFTAATIAASRWVDGTSAGSAANDTFGWIMSPSWTGTDGDVSFDSSTEYSGSYSLKISKTSATGGTSGGAVGLGTLVSPTIDTQRKYFIPVKPSTDYKLVFYLKTDSVSSLNSAGARARVLMYDGVATGSVSSANSSYVIGTTGWQRIEVKFTTAATAYYANVWLQLDNETGTAWFDDVSLAPVYPDARDMVGENMIKNSGFEIAPTFVAATTSTPRWIDGTAAGSTTNSSYKWSVETSGTSSCRFDDTVFKNGSSSMKLSTSAVASFVEVSSVRGTPSVTSLRADGMQVAPSTSYTCTYWMKTNYVSGDSAAGATAAIQEFDAAGTAIATTVGTYVKSTLGWTQYSFTFTTAATAAYVRARARIYGHTGTATLIMDAWFDDITFGPTYSHA